MLSKRLKDETLDSHQQLEKKVVTQIKAVGTPDDYAKLIRLFYGYFGGVEAAIALRPQLIFLSDYDQRRKSVALANDLKLLNSSLPVIATESSLPGLENEFQIAGALYVMEGSTLGGKFIVKMLKEKLAQISPDAFSFFVGYQEDTGKMWQRFIDAINKMSLNEVQENEVIESANDTFSHFAKWIDAQLINNPC